MSYLSYIQIFATYFCSILLYFFPGTITYKRFALILAIITSCILAFVVIKNKFVVHKLFFCTTLFFLFIVFSYKFVTPLLYNKPESSYFEGEFLALTGQTFPYSLTALVVCLYPKVQNKMKHIAMYIGLLFAVIALACTVWPNMTTTGLAAYDNNLNYQSLSYLAAYAAALALYHMFSLRQVEASSTKTDIFICYAIIVLSFFTILLSGGRGGLVAYFVFLIMSIIIHKKTTNTSLNSILKGLIIITVFLICFISVIRVVANSNIVTSGYGRLLRFLQGAGDSIRVRLYKTAIESFIEKPLFGHGFGSVFYEMGFYSHNIITDLLVETGIIGTCICILLLAYVFKVAIVLIKIDVSDSIWLYFLLTGITMLMFSGYYLSSVNTWWAVFFILGKARMPQKKQ